MSATDKRLARLRAIVEIDMRSIARSAALAELEAMLAESTDPLTHAFVVDRATAIRAEAEADSAQLRQFQAEIG